MNNALPIKLYPNKTKQKWDDYKIYVRVIVDRKKAEVSTNYYINPNNWNIDKGRSIKNDLLNDYVRIPLLKEALEIIEKYKNDPAREVFGFILPRYTNQKINAYLKVIADICDIKKPVTHHVARHSFATIALNRNLPMEVVQKLLGHQNLRTTQIYAKMMMKTVVKVMDKLSDVFKWKLTMFIILDFLDIHRNYVQFQILH